MAKDSFEQSRKEWGSGFIGYKSKTTIVSNPINENWLYVMFRNGSKIKFGKKVLKSK